MQPTLLLPNEVRGRVTMKEAVAAVQQGFREWGEDPQVNAPRRRIHIPTGVRVSVHQGGVPGAGATGLMTHCEWVRPLADHQEYPRLNHPVTVLYDGAEGDSRRMVTGSSSSVTRITMKLLAPAAKHRRRSRWWLMWMRRRVWKFPTRTRRWC